MKIFKFKEFKFELKINELKSIDSYNVVNFIESRILKEYEKNSDSPSKLLVKLIEIITESMLEFYKIKDNKINRDKIKSAFSKYFKIRNNKIEFDYLFPDGDEMQTYELHQHLGYILKIINIEVGKVFPNEIDNLELQLKPFKYGGDSIKDDVLKKNIYDWEYTFETLDKLLYDFLVGNVDDVDFKRFKLVIDKNLDNLKDFVEKKEYEAVIKNESSSISTIDSKKITDKIYLIDYVGTLHNFLKKSNLVDNDFLDLLSTFLRWIDTGKVSTYKKELKSKFDEERRLKNEEERLGLKKLEDELKLENERLKTLESELNRIENDTKHISIDFFEKTLQPIKKRLEDANKDVLCYCQSGRKYKNCHRQDDLQTFKPYRYSIQQMKDRIKFPKLIEESNKKIKTLSRQIEEEKKNRKNIMLKRLEEQRIALEDKIKKMESENTTDKDSLNKMKNALQGIKKQIQEL
jgi:hypothetical protein